MRSVDQETQSCLALIMPCIMVLLFVLCADTRKEGASILLVLKWGGELTPAGRVQAEELGRAFRCMYPGGQGEKKKNPPVCLSLRGPILTI